MSYQKNNFKPPKPSSTTTERLQSNNTNIICNTIIASTNETSTTKSPVDSSLMNLVKDFFNSQFELKKAQCPFSVQNNNTNNMTNNNPTTMKNTNYNRVKAAFRALGQAFESKYEKQLYEIIKQLDLQPNNCCATFFSLSNEMFVHGIKWNHIVTYFVFSADFAFYASQEGAATAMDVAQWLVRYTSDNLVPWIENHGGWDGIVNFAHDTVGNIPNNNESLLNFNLKNILCGAVGALGVLSLGLFLSSK